MTVLRSASRQALDALLAQENALYEASGKKAASADDLVAFAEQLYAVADLLVAQPRLRRTLGDPASAPEARAALLENLLGGKVADAVLELAKHAVSQRWSTPWDLTDALEGAGDDALFAAAAKQGSLEQVEDELFRLERILDANGEAVGLLDEQTVEPARRNQLLDSVVAKKVSPITLALLHHAVASQRKRSIVLAIDDLLDKTAARQNRSVARVVSATPLTDAQERRLAKALSAMYDRPISVRTALDPDLRGGLVVRVGDEVIDGSIAARFAAARSALAG
jgi:F-type H+-transporting ATPase subunit delta